MKPLGDGKRPTRSLRACERRARAVKVRDRPSAARRDRRVRMRRMRRARRDALAQGKFDEALLARLVPARLSLAEDTALIG